MTRRFVVASGEDVKADFAAAEVLLARLAARAFAADHPEMFRPSDGPTAEDMKNAGPPAAAAAVGSAPLPNAGDPAELELEQDDSIVSSTEAG